MAISTQQKRNATRKLSISTQVIKARGQPLKSSDFVRTNVDAEMLFRDAPFAKANKGYRIALLDDGLEGQVIYSNGDRYVAEGSQLIFRPTLNTTPTRGNTLIKHAEIRYLTQIKRVLCGMTVIFWNWPLHINATVLPIPAAFLPDLS